MPPTPTIYTASFSRVRLLPPNVRAVSIARWPPRTWGKRPRCMALAPAADLLRAIKASAITWDQYSKAYNAQLAALDPKAIAKELDGSCALCFCPPGYACHRRLVAAWLETSLHVAVPEFGFARDLVWPFPPPHEHIQVPMAGAPIDAGPWTVRCDHCRVTVHSDLTETEILCPRCARTFRVEWDAA